ncbi:MAG: hypothetical protein AAF639_26770 [Chloroflexota bacterium]
MMTATKPLTEIMQDALRMLYRDLGIVNTIRFLSQFTTGFGNYTEERRQITEHEMLEDVLADVYAYQAQRAS